MTALTDALPAPLREVLDFWFGPPDDPNHHMRRPHWFQSTPELDAAIRERFLATHETAATGGFDDARTHHAGSLAVILLLDQLPRNMFRGEPRSFATDALAREVARAAVAAGHPAAWPALHRIFFLLPFEHSEDLADQRTAMALFERLPSFDGHERSLKAAQRHHEIIERFGRFPHRNAILGRLSTAEEIEFLKEPYSQFIWPTRVDEGDAGPETQTPRT